MAKRVLVRFPSDRPYEYYTNVFYFAEALWGPIVDGGLGTLEDIEHAREAIRIDLASPRKRGAVEVIVKRVLKRHHLLEDATISTE